MLTKMPEPKEIMYRDLDKRLPNVVSTFKDDFEPANQLIQFVIFGKFAVITLVFFYNLFSYFFISKFEMYIYSISLKFVTN